MLILFDNSPPQFTVVKFSTISFDKNLHFLTNTSSLSFFVMKISSLCFFLIVPGHGLLTTFIRKTLEIIFLQLKPPR